MNMERKLAFSIPSPTIRSSRLIPQIKSPSGSILTNHKDIISDYFSTFYSSLYSSECPDNLSLIESFFSSIKLPSVGDQLKSELGHPLATLPEIVEFFKKSTLLSPLLLARFIESSDRGYLPNPL